MFFGGEVRCGCADRFAGESFLRGAVRRVLLGG
jgi:hypothetical protein